MIGKRILGDPDAAARPCIDAIILVHHVVIAAHWTVFGQKQDALEIEEGGAERDGTAEPAGLLVKGVTIILQRGIHRVGLRDEGVGLVSLGGKIRSTGLPGEMSQQGFRPAKHDIKRIAVTRTQERCGMFGLRRHALRARAIPHLHFQMAELRAPFVWQIRGGLGGKAGPKTKRSSRGALAATLIETPLQAIHSRIAKPGR